MSTKPSSKRGTQRLVAVITARLSSQRLPGKVLRALHGRPMLAHVVDRLHVVTGIDDIVIATSTDLADDAVMAFADDVGVRCQRGSINDVLGRITEAAFALRADAIVRISGDSPLLDPRLVETAINLFGNGSADIVTNVFPRSFPQGQSVEVLSRAVLERLAAQAHETDDREHVTRYAYTHPESYVIRNFSARNPRPGLQLSVDTEADLQRASALLTAYRGPSQFPSVDRLVSLAEELALAQ